MHVMHVIDRLDVGGAERMLVDLANQSAGDGHNVSVCITRSGGKLLGSLREDLHVIELGRKRRFELKAARRLASYVKRYGVDLMHVHGRSSFSFAALLRALRLLSTPILLHDHCSIEVDDSVPWWFVLGGRRYVAHYVGVYEKLALWAQTAGVPAGRISVVGNALDLSRVLTPERTNIRKELGISPDTPVGIVVAGLRHEKGTDVLLTAMSQLAFEGPWVLLIVGREQDKTFVEYCHGLCRGLDLEDQVIFIGERDDVPSLLREVDFAVMPSRSESGPLVLIEYVAAGLPVVATLVGDVSQKMKALGVPEFVEPGQPGALARAIDRLLRMGPEERQRRGAIGRDVAWRYFDIRSVMPAWYTIYQQITAAQ